VPLEIRVNRDTCIGSGNCCFHAPATFDLDDDLKATVVDSDGDGVDAVKRAADGCPTRSISVEEP
jgi:ferredoxin